MVIDARTGKVLHARNADTRLHPASLTKMMTLYVVFDAIKHGEITLDTMVTITRKAANEPPSKLGLRAGQRIKLRYLIRAAAVKSANDAATALGIAISGSEAKFAQRMTSMARKMGMSRTTFKNANGLTRSGHLSTARDMTTLGRHLFFDYPQYYNLFSRKSTNAGVRNVVNTNRKLLAAYRGADGIKTGYTNAAGFNLVASAQRGGKRVIATVFGGRTSAWRNQRVAELLDMGFKRSPTRVAVRKPVPVEWGGGGAKTIRVASNGAVGKSLRPRDRVNQPVTQQQAKVDSKAIEAAILQAVKDDKKPEPQPQTQPVQVARAQRPVLRVVTRVSSAGGRHWGVQIGTFSARQGAEKALLQTALRELRTLEQSERRIDYAMVSGNMRYRARFVGLNQAEANMTCARLKARHADCIPIRTGG
jgi:D-alanyl-D-alanine carboxypeptidase